MGRPGLSSQIDPICFVFWHVKNGGKHPSDLGSQVLLIFLKHFSSVFLYILPSLFPCKKVVIYNKWYFCRNDLFVNAGYSD